MASISLPKSLYPRRTSLEQDRENFEKFQALSIQKAINIQETPVKEKHVRSAIIGTYQEKGAATFWSCITKQQIQGNPIIAWKFCHVLHKVLREGHQHVLPDSQQYRPMIVDVGRLWGHLKEGYGKLIQHYTRLLVTKLDFHRRNPRFPGNLQITTDLETIAENDINAFFQMSVEMFDYMDEILALETAVFSSLDMSRANSMTSAGQCRLAPLIPCIQDSSFLYDYCVKILFKLHASLPADTLSGHRERFLKQFRELQRFYINSSTLQYFKCLIQVPLLPENPPNFLIAAELSSHVTPVVRLPPEPENDGDNSDTVSRFDAVSDLVDLGENTNGSTSPDILFEKERLIEHLMQEIDRLKMEICRIREDHSRMVDILNQRIMELENKLSEQENDLLIEKQTKDDLLEQMSIHSQNAEASVKAEEAEKTAKANEERFQKMKNIYSALRDEHVQLLRVKAEVEKQLSTVKKNSEEHEQRSAELEKRLTTVLEERSVAVNNLQQSSEQNDAQSQELVALREELASLKEEFEVVVSELTLASDELTNKCKSLSDENDLCSTEMQELNHEKAAVEEKLASTIKNLEITEQSRADLESKLSSVLEEKSEIMNDLTQTSVKSEDYMRHIAELQNELEVVKENMEMTVSRLTEETAELTQTCTSLSNDKDSYFSETQELAHQKADVEEELSLTTRKLENTEKLRADLENQLAIVLDQKSQITNDFHLSSEKNYSQAKMITELKEEIESTKQHFNARISELHQENTELTNACKTLSGEKDSYICQVEELTNQKTDVEQQFISMKQNWERAEKSKNELDNQLASALEVVSLKEKLDVEISEHRQKIVDLTNTCKSLSDEKDSYVVKIQEMQVTAKKTEDKLQQDFQQQLASILEIGINEAESVIKKSLEEVDSSSSAGITCTPDFFATIAEPLFATLTGIQEHYSAYRTNPWSLGLLLKSLSHFSHIISSFLFQGKGTSQTSHDIEKGDALFEECRKTGLQSLELLTTLKINPVENSLAENSSSLHSQIETVMGMVQALINAAKGEASEQIGDLLDDELATMDKAIEEAASRMQELLEKSREADTGVKLEVNGKILDSCTNLMRMIRMLVHKAKDLQSEIVAQGKGTASVKEFYKRNHQWTEGLLSAAKAVGLGARFLVDAADKVVKGQAKFEQLMVASQEIAASTAQLVVASRVKADRSSKALSALSQASRGVTQATGNVVATAKSCSEMVEESDVMDFTKMSHHQAKRMEMETQVHVLELESALSKERMKLASIRKHNYRQDPENIDQ